MSEEKKNTPDSENIPAEKQDNAPEALEVQQVNAENIAEEEKDPAMESLASALGMGFLMLKLCMLAGVLYFFWNGFFTVKDGSSKMVRRFGSYIKTADGAVKIYKPGSIYYAIPMIESVETVEHNEISFDVDTDFMPKKNPFNTNEVKQTLKIGEDGYLITGDTNIVHAKWIVTYRITDPHKFMTSFQDRETNETNKQTGAVIIRNGPEQLLHETVRNCIIKATAGTSVDAILTDGKDEYVKKITNMVAKVLNNHPCGIGQAKVKLVIPEIPSATKAAFAAVNDERTRANSKIERANKVAQQIETAAVASANQIRNDAKNYASSLVQQAKADADSMNKLLAKFEGDPEALAIYVNQRHSEWISDILAQSRIIVMRKGNSWYYTAMPSEDEMYVEQKSSGVTINEDDSDLYIDEPDMP